VVLDFTEALEYCQDDNHNHQEGQEGGKGSNACLVGRRGDSIGGGVDGANQVCSDTFCNLRFHGVSAHVINSNPFHFELSPLCALHIYENIPIPDLARRCHP